MRKLLPSIAFPLFMIVCALPAHAQVNALNDTVVHYPADTARVSVDTADDPYAFTQVDQEPRAKVGYLKFFHYPEEARRAGKEGIVFLRFQILEDGMVGKILVERTAGLLLDNAAVRAIRSSSYYPALRNGKPVRVWTSQSIVFRLH